MPRLTIAIPLTALTLSGNENGAAVASALVTRPHRADVGVPGRRTPSRPRAASPTMTSTTQPDTQWPRLLQRGGGRGRLRSGPGPVTGVRHDGRHAGDL